MWICERLSDKRIIGSQSKPSNGVLIRNALNGGEEASNLNELELSDAEFILRRKVQDEADKSYDQKRQAAYPPIGDQLDDLFRAGRFTPEMAAKIQAVKDQYQKPI